MKSAPAWVESGDLSRLAQASARLREWSAGLGGELAAVFAQMAATTGAAAAQGAEPYLLPVSQPVVLLPLWLSRGLGDAVVVDLLGSALAGYLTVRVQDDWCDARAGDAEHALLLSTALAARHATLCGRLAVGAAYWALHDDRWARYAAAMAFERRVATGEIPYGEVEFQRVLDRSRPLILPGAAALALTGRWAAVPDLSVLVDHLVAAHQRFDDVRDGLDDLRAGLRTPVLVRSGVRSAGAWLAWLAAGGADDELGKAAVELDEAAVAARRLGIERAELWIDARRAAMVTWQANWRSGPMATLLLADKTM